MSSDHHPYRMPYPYPLQSNIPPGDQMSQGGHPIGGYPMGGYGVYHDPSYAYAAMQARAYPAQQSSAFLRGLLIGAAVTYLVTNESVQRTAIKGAVKAWSLVHGGMEELKERFRDAEAELHSAEAAKEE